MTPDVHSAHNEIGDPTYDKDPIEEKTTSSRTNVADSWGPVPTKKASVANLAPYLLPYFNNGPVFGLPGCAQADRTCLEVTERHRPRIEERLLA